MKNYCFVLLITLLVVSCKKHTEVLIHAVKSVHPGTDPLSGGWPFVEFMDDSTYGYYCTNKAFPDYSGNWYRTDSIIHITRTLNNPIKTNRLVMRTRPFYLDESTSWAITTIYQMDENGVVNESAMHFQH